MTPSRKTIVLTGLGLVDLGCFALSSQNYGEYWSLAGVIGLLLFLALFEYL